MIRVKMAEREQLNILQAGPCRVELILGAATGIDHDATYAVNPDDVSSGRAACGRARSARAENLHLHTAVETGRPVLSGKTHTRNSDTDTGSSSEGSHSSFPSLSIVR